MPQTLLAGILVAHGAITSMIGLTTLANPTGAALELPSWFDWWPGPFGRSWLFEQLGLGSTASLAGGLLWLAAGLVLIAAGLGWLGVPGARDAWEALAVLGAAVGLVALALYFHPLYVVAVAIDVVVLAGLWTRVGVTS